MMVLLCSSLFLLSMRQWPHDPYLPVIVQTPVPGNSFCCNSQSWAEIGWLATSLHSLSDIIEDIIMADIKLTYFDLRAKGEAARLLLAYSGLGWVTTSFYLGFTVTIMSGTGGRTTELCCRLMTPLCGAPWSPACPGVSCPASPSRWKYHDIRIDKLVSISSIFRVIRSASLWPSAASWRGRRALAGETAWKSPWWTRSLTSSRTPSRPMWEPKSRFFLKLSFQYKAWYSPNRREELVKLTGQTFPTTLVCDTQFKLDKFVTI